VIYKSVHFLQIDEGDTEVMSNTLLHMLTRRCKEKFEKDFPLYLIIAYRFFLRIPYVAQT